MGTLLIESSNEVSAFQNGTKYIQNVYTYVYTYLEYVIFMTNNP